jgi:hypothetical protein
MTTGPDVVLPVHNEGAFVASTSRDFRRVMIAVYLKRVGER